MDRKLKIIWDFRGINSLKIAEHHVIHLKEFARTEHLTIENICFKEVSDIHSIAYIITDEAVLHQIKHRLKPHRAEWLE